MSYRMVLDLDGDQNSASKQGVDIELSGVCRILGAEVV